MIIPINIFIVTGFQVDYSESYNLTLVYINHIYSLCLVYKEDFRSIFKYNKVYIVEEIKEVYQWA